MLISGQRFFDSRTSEATPEDLEVTRVPDGEETALAADGGDTYVDDLASRIPGSKLPEFTQRGTEAATRRATKRD